MGAEEVNKAVESVLDPLPNIELALPLASFGLSLFALEDGCLQFPVSFIVLNWCITYVTTG